jgi:hypothetical protein
MGARLRSWWQQIKLHPVATVLIALFVAFVVLVVLGGYKLNWGWTGFNGNNKSGKTLWDWLQLLFIPGVLTLGAVWITARQNHDLQIAERQRQAERELAEDKYREDTLQDYIDKMSELLLREKLRDSAKADEVRKIARVRTLTVLHRLDGVRKRNVLLFLHESGLIYEGNHVIDLGGADLNGAKLNRAGLTQANLSQANLSQANLSGAMLAGTDLRKANLSKADLNDANLIFADFNEADLSGANLSKAALNDANLGGADLSGADLSGATVTTEQLEKAQSLEGAIMPDDTIHP